MGAQPVEKAQCTCTPQPHGVGSLEHFRVSEVFCSLFPPPALGRFVVGVVRFRAGVWAQAVSQGDKVFSPISPISKYLLVQKRS